MPPFLTSYVVIRDGRLTAYASALHFWPLNHAVAETEDDMQALLMGAGNSRLASQSPSYYQRDRRAYFAGA